MIQRRLQWLEYGENDYFKEGMAIACRRAIAKGYAIEPFHESTYPYLDDNQVSEQLGVRQRSNHAM